MHWAPALSAQVAAVCAHQLPGALQTHLPNARAPIKPGPWPIFLRTAVSRDPPPPLTCDPSCGRGVGREADATGASRGGLMFGPLCLSRSGSGRGHGVRLTPGAGCATTASVACCRHQNKPASNKSHRVFFFSTRFVNICLGF